MHSRADFQTQRPFPFFTPTNCQCTQSACSEDWSTTAAAWISAFTIMTLRGCSAVVCSHMKCHLEFDKIWRNNPLRVRCWTLHFLILFTRYNQGLSGDPCHCAIKLIIFLKNYCRLGCLEVRVTAGALVLLKWLDLLQIFHVFATNFVPQFVIVVGRKKR